MESPPSTSTPLVSTATDIVSTAPAPFPVTADQLGAGFFIDYSGPPRDDYQRDHAHWFGIFSRFGIDPS